MNNEFRLQLYEYLNNPKQKGLNEKQKTKATFASVESCDDLFNIYIETEENKIKVARFDGNGCAISNSSIEAVLRLIEGLNFEDANNFIDSYEKFINGQTQEVHENLKLFKIVQTHKSRKKCALAPIETIRKAIN